MEEYHKTLILPNQLIYKKFVSLLPDDLDILQGLEGPNIFKHKETLYYLESYNSFEFARRQGVDSLNRKGKFISFEKNSNVLLSILNEDIYQTFMHAYDYFDAPPFLKDDTYLIDYWDLYVKVYLYHKYWKDELIYFPKYQGPEGIEWIMNGPKMTYRKQMVAVSISSLIDLMSSNQGYKKYIQQQDPI
jgi:hypothetical protein